MQWIGAYRNAVACLHPPCAVPVPDIPLTIQPERPMNNLPVDASAAPLALRVRWTDDPRALTTFNLRGDRALHARFLEALLRGNVTALHGLPADLRQMVQHTRTRHVGARAVCVPDQDHVLRTRANDLEWAATAVDAELLKTIWSVRPVCGDRWGNWVDETWSPLTPAENRHRRPEPRPVIRRPRFPLPAARRSLHA